MANLPRFVAFRDSNHRYVMRLRVGNSGSASTWPEFDQDNVVVLIPYAPSSTKFELVPSQSGRGLTHIRSCCNNKYLARSSSGSNTNLSASADKPEEDQSKWTCTLFRIAGSGSGTTLFADSVYHVQTGRYAVVGRGSSRPLRLDTAPMRLGIVDWESILIFPELVIFKGDNDKNLRARPENTTTDSWSLELTADEDEFCDEETIFSSRYGKDGSVRFMTIIPSQTWNRKMWVRVETFSNHIWAHAPSNSTGEVPDTMFWALRVRNTEAGNTEAGNTEAKNRVVLQSVVNRLFCRRSAAMLPYPLGMRRDILCANSSSSTIPEAILEVREAVFSRTVYNVTYRLNDAVTYNEGRVPLTSTYRAENNGSSSQQRKLPISYKVTESSRWDHSVLIGAEVSTSFKCRVPFIKFGTLSSSLTLSAAYEREWGKTEDTTKELEIEHVVIVPPRTVVTVRVVATRGTSDVPFSYTQRELLANGTHVIRQFHDGVFTGINTYNFHYETTSQPL